MDSDQQIINVNSESEAPAFDGIEASRGGSIVGAAGNYAAIPPFLLKIHDMLNNKETKSVISWRESGTSFVVTNPHAFADNVLPLYFRHNNFQSFVAQLNSYGFRKISWEHWEYSNEFFRKGEKHLLANIKRRNQFSNTTKYTSSNGRRQSTCMELELEAMANEHAHLKAELAELRDKQRTLEKKLDSLRNQAAMIKSTKDRILRITAGLSRKRKVDTDDGDDDKPIDTIMCSDHDHEFGGLSEHFSNKEKDGDEEMGKNSAQMTEALISLEEMMFGLEPSSDWAEYFKDLLEKAAMSSAKI